MRARRTWRLLTAAALLAACGSGGSEAGAPITSVAEFGLGRGDPEEREFVLTVPPGPSVEAVPEWSFEPSVAWVNDGRYLGVVTFGSGSCPSGPHAIEVVADHEIAIHLERLPVQGDACSADVSGYVTVVGLPEGVTPTRPLVTRFDDQEVTIAAVG